MTKKADPATIAVRGLVSKPVHKTVSGNNWVSWFAIEAAPFLVLPYFNTDAPTQASLSIYDRDGHSEVNTMHGADGDEYADFAVFHRDGIEAVEQTVLALFLAVK